jgi:hypothetical protein
MLLGRRGNSKIKSKFGNLSTQLSTVLEYCSLSILIKLNLWSFHTKSVVLGALRSCHTRLVVLWSRICGLVVLRSYGL